MKNAVLGELKGVERKFWRLGADAAQIQREGAGRKMPLSARRLHTEAFAQNVLHFSPRPPASH